MCSSASWFQELGPLLFPRDESAWAGYLSLRRRPHLAGCAGAAVAFIVNSSSILCCVITRSRFLTERFLHSDLSWALDRRPTGGCPPQNQVKKKKQKKRQYPGTFLALYPFLFSFYNLFPKEWKKFVTKFYAPMFESLLKDTKHIIWIIELSTLQYKTQVVYYNPDLYVMDNNHVNVLFCY